MTDQEIAQEIKRIENQENQTGRIFDTPYHIAQRRDGLWNLYRQKSPKGSVLYVGCFAQSALIGILKSGQKQSS